MSYDAWTRTPVWLRWKLETLLESPSPAQPTPARTSVSEGLPQRLGALVPCSVWQRPFCNPTTFSGELTSPGPFSLPLDLRSEFIFWISNEATQYLKIPKGVKGYRGWKYVLPPPLHPPRLFKSIQRTYTMCWNTVLPGPGRLYIILYNYWYQFSVHLPPKSLCLHWQAGPCASMCGFFGCCCFLIFWWSCCV